MAKRCRDPNVPAIVLLILTAFMVSEAAADTIHMKNGGSFEGIIEKENKDAVEVNIGSGTVTIMKSDIVSISRSSSEERAELYQKQAEKAEETEKRRGEFEEARDKRFREYEEWSREAERKKRESVVESGRIQAARDPDSGHTIMNAVLNGRVKAALILDTGASLILLSKRVGTDLGIDLTSTRNDIMALNLAGGKKVEAKGIVLESVAIDGITEKNIPAAVLLEEVVDVGFKDGLLGMSFLKFYNVKLDQKTMAMVFERLK